MKFVLKWVFRIVLVLVLLIVALIIFKDEIIRVVAEQRIHAETGMEAKIGKLKVGILSPVFTMENFKLYNTAEFGGSPFIDIPELHVEYDRDALSSGKLHIKLLRFNLAELSVVKNEAGKTNITALTKTGGGKGGKSGKSPARKLSGFEFGGIDRLNLTLGKVRFADLKTPANNREINLGMKDQVFSKVKTESDLAGILLVVYLKSGGNFFGDSGGGGLGLFGDPTGKAGGSAKKVTRIPATTTNK